MVVVKVKDQEYYMDGYLLKNSAYIKDRVLKHNNMMIMIVDGRPGTGKSTFVAQHAHYMSDGNFNIDYECFTAKQFSDALKKSKKGDSIVLDEAFDVLNKRRTQSLSNMIGLSLLQKMRSKQVFIYIVLPSLYDLDKNLILNLCDLFVHCYRQPFGSRGQYTAWDIDELRKLWINCRQIYDYKTKWAKPNFYARFTKYFPIDYDAYEDKKQASINQFEASDNTPHMIQRDKLIKHMYDGGIKPTVIGKIIGMRRETIHESINRRKEVEAFEAATPAADPSTT